MEREQTLNEATSKASVCALQLHRAMEEKQLMEQTYEL
jgi:hypothetical protein